MAIKKYLQFIFCLFAELRSELNEGIEARAKYKEIEQLTSAGWND